MNPLVEHHRHLTRREFFGRAATGIGGTALASLLGRQGLLANEARRPEPPSGLPGLPGLPHFAPKAKRVIYLFMNGAPTHVDLFDWKPRLLELDGKPFDPGAKVELFQSDPGACMAPLPRAHQGCPTAGRPGPGPAS